AQTYPLASADVGATMRVAVTASNTTGSATASSAATGVVAATTSTSSSSSLLTWAPPALVNPITVPIQDTGLAAPTLPGQNAGQPWVVNLDPSQDYILEIRHRHTGPIEGLSINGGHNVVIIGGEITDDLALAPDSTAEYRQGGLIFHNQTGVV